MCRTTPPTRLSPETAWDIELCRPGEKALARPNAYAAASSALQGARVLWVKVAPPTLEQMFDPKPWPECFVTDEELY